MEEILKLFDLTVLDAQMIAVFAVIFVVFWKVLDKIFFAPYLAIIEKREELTVQADKRAEELLSAAKELREVYEKKILEKQVQAVKEKLDKVSKAKEEANEIISTANLEAKRYIEKRREEIKEHINNLREDLQEAAEQMAEELALKLTDVNNYKLKDAEVN